MVQGREDWRTPEDTWIEIEDEEEEVFFVSIVQVEEVNSDAELEAEIARTEKAIDDCFRRRAKRAGKAVDGPEDRLMGEEERDRPSERLGDGDGVRAKRKREIEEMEEEAMKAEIKRMEKILEKKRGMVKPSRLGSPPLALTILCLVGGQVSALTAYDCSNKCNVIESYSLLEPDVCANSDKAGGDNSLRGNLQIKQDQMIPVFRCQVIETIMSQYCRHFWWYKVHPF